MKEGQELYNVPNMLIGLFGLESSVSKNGAQMYASTMILSLLESC